MKKRVIFVTFADLGKKNNLKTDFAINLIHKLESIGTLDKVICRINYGFYFKDTVGSINLFFHYFLKIIELLFFGKLFVRKFEEYLLDYKTSKIIKKGDIVIFYPEYFFKKTLYKAKKNQILTIGIASMAYSKFNAQLENEEFRLFNICEKEKKYRFYQKLASRNNNELNFSYLITFSDFVCESYVKFGFSREKIFVIQNDIFLKDYQKKDKKDDIFRICYVAFTNPLKGLHYLLDAWDSLNLKNSELLIIGDFINLPREFKNYYLSKIKKSKSIKFIKKIAKKDVYFYLNNSSVFCFPSLTEGGSRAVLEAMALGLPIITTLNAKGLVVNGVNGWVVPIRESKILAEKINFFYNNPKILKEMGQNSVSIFYNKKLFIDEFSFILDKIISNEKDSF